MTMQIYCSPSTNGFYEEGAQPADAVAITDERHAELLDGFSNGKVLTWRGGKPILSTPDGPTIDTEKARAAAIQQEAMPLFMQFQYSGAAGDEKAWRDKMADIAERYPQG